jgi:hypothetical protein
MNATTQEKDMPREVTSLVYKYAELSDEAKERAREWLRGLVETDDYAPHVIDDFTTIAGYCGWDINQRPVKLIGGGTRYDPAVWWSGFSSQGDGACFEGNWKASDVNTRALYKHAPKDEELCRIGREFAALKKAAPNGSARVAQRGPGSHEGCTDFDFYDMGSERVADAREERLKKASRDLMRWVYRALEREYEYQTSDEQIAESIEANEYEFTEDGSRA